MSVQGLPRNAEFLAQITHLRSRLPHCGHRQAQLGCGHLERPAAFPATCPRRRQASNQVDDGVVDLYLLQRRSHGGRHTTGTLQVAGLP